MKTFGTQIYWNTAGSCRGAYTIRSACQWHKGCCAANLQSS